LADVNNLFLTLVGSALEAAASYRASVLNLTTRVKSQQRALDGALLDVDRMMRLYGRHLLLQSYTTHFLRDDNTESLVQQGRKPPMTGLSTTAYPLTEEDWELAQPATIAQARSEGSMRTRLQEAFALIPMPHRAFPLHCPSSSVFLDGVCDVMSPSAHRKSMTNSQFALHSMVGPTSTRTTRCWMGSSS